MSAPVRIQRSRAKGSKLVSPNGLPVVCVTRPGPFGNPFRVGANVPDVGDELTLSSKASCVEHFRLWLKLAEDGRAFARRAKKELRGCNLACWCKAGAACHADVLLELANA